VTVQELIFGVPEKHLLFAGIRSVAHGWNPFTMRSS
jgi:hypothetical protein